MTPSAVMHGRNHICISPCKKKTPEQFQQQVEALVGEEYTVLSEYQNAFAHVKMRHNACGLEYSVAPAPFLPAQEGAVRNAAENASRVLH